VRRLVGIDRCRSSEAFGSLGVKTGDRMWGLYSLSSFSPFSAQ